MNLLPKSILFSAILFFLSITGYSQNSNPKFGKVNLNDFEIKKCEFEENANAIYLFEYGKSEIVNYDGDLFIRTNLHAKIKILTEEGIDEGNFEYPLYRNSKEEEAISKLKAITYNKNESGEVEKTYLDKSQIFLEKRTDNLSFYKFAMPQVKKGSILEFEYVKLSPFIFNFETWYFQANIPKLNSEFTAIIPANFQYNVRLQGSLNLKSVDSKRLRDHFHTPIGRSDASRLLYTMQNIPSFKKERYITTSKNYISMIKYELKLYKSFRGGNTNYTKTWKDIEKSLLNDDRFGDQFDVKILREEVNNLVSSNTDQLKLSKEIFKLVKEKIVFNGKHRLYCTKGGIKNALKNGNGNSADVNLLLLNTLLRAGIEADAIAISTRGNGFINKLYPVISEFNYVIVRVKVNNKTILLDATRKNVPFGLLPFECYNVRGKVIAKDSGWIDLNTEDNFFENSQVLVTLNHDLSFTAKIKNIYGNQSAVRLLDKLDRYNSVDEYVENLEEKGSWLYEDYTISNRENIDKGIVEEFSIEDNFEGIIKNDRILFNPIIINNIKENPFKLKSRSYPVDYGLPTRIKTTYIITIPKGYELARQYRPVKLALPDNIGYYQYSLSPSSEGRILLRTSFIINNKVISPSNYLNLKSFYNSVINKNNSMIELRRIDLTAHKTQ